MVVISIADEIALFAYIIVSALLTVISHISYGLSIANIAFVIWKQKIIVFLLLIIIFFKTFFVFRRLKIIIFM